MEPTILPGSRLDSQFVYDVKADKLILFSGLILPGFHTDTWAYDFDSNTWTNMSPPTLPQGRGAHLIAYDEESDRTILFSGSEKGPPNWTCWNDTWAYNLNENSWSNMSPTIQPSGRAFGNMVYDNDSDRIILFGGFSGDTLFGETWAYDFNTNEWSNKNPSTHPLPRWGHSMAYDKESDRVILYGGSKTPPSPPLELLNDTWAYDYDTNTWTNMNPTTSPPELQALGLTYDTKSDRVILFGGADKTLSNLGETWSYDFNTNTWMNETSSSSLGPRRRFAMTYDEQSDRTILFGGFHGGMALNETWSFEYQLDGEITTTTTTTTTSTTTPTTSDATSFTLLIVTTGFFAISILRKRWNHR
jgi:hypothetical protein